MKKFIKKYYLLIAILFLVPIVVLIFFLNDSFESEAENISLLCAVFTYYGTIVLAFVTVMQNDKITEISEKSARIEEIQLSNKYHPLIDIESIKDDKDNDLITGGIYKNGFGFVKQIQNIDSDIISVVLKNKGNSSAYNVEVYDYGLVQPENWRKDSSIFDYMRSKKAEIPKKDSFCFQLHFEDNAMLKLDFNLCYQNEFGNCFYNPIKVELINEEGKRTAQIGISEQVKGKVNMNVNESYFRID